MHRPRHELPISVLNSDAYKWMMTRFGFPFGWETFVLFFRKGGWQIVPCDLRELVRSFRPTAPATPEEHAWLARYGYNFETAIETALLEGDLDVRALPRGAWFYEKEPILTVTGPSFPASWLEALSIRIHFRIQVATLALLDPEELRRLCAFACTEEEADLVEETLAQVQALYPNEKVPHFRPQVETARYADAVGVRVRGLIDAVGGDAGRLFEVGARSVFTESQHRVSLQASKEAGLLRTSNLAAAYTLGMIPAGSGMGHEAIERTGSDLTTFRDARDRTTGPLSFLPDTFSTLRSGVPAALTVMRETPARALGLRFDSEKHIRSHYLAATARMREIGMEPPLTLEGGWNEELTREFEKLAQDIKWPLAKQFYGIGEYINAPPWPHLGRNRVSAVYKLSKSRGRACMKTGDEPNGGKKSPPGEPETARPRCLVSGYRGPVGVIVQRGELDERDESLLTGREVVPSHLRFSIADVRTLQKCALQHPPVPSPATAALMEQCRAEREANLLMGVRLDDALTSV